MSTRVVRTIIFCFLLAFTIDNSDAAGPVSVEISFVPSATLPFQAPEQKLLITNHSGDVVRLPRFFRMEVETGANTLMPKVPYPAVESDQIIPEELVVGDVEQLLGSLVLEGNETKVIVFSPSHFLERWFLQDDRLTQPGRYAAHLEFFSEGSGRRDELPDRPLASEDFSSNRIEFIIEEPEGEDKQVLAQIREYVSKLPRAGLQERWQLARSIWNESRSSSYAPYVAAFVSSPKSEERVAILEEAVRLASGMPVASHLEEVLAVTRLGRAHELLRGHKNAAAANEQYQLARVGLERLLAENPNPEQRLRLETNLSRIPTPESIRMTLNDQE